MTSARKLAFISDGAAAGARAIAERLVSHGMRVMLNLGPDQDEEGAKTAFGKDLWESVLWSRGDLSQGASAGRVLSQTIEQFGTVDVLIHNSQWIVATSLEHAGTAPILFDARSRRISPLRKTASRSHRDRSSPNHHPNPAPVWRGRQVC